MCILGFRTLLTAYQNQHHHVQYFAWVWSVTGRQDHIDDQQSAIGLHGFATMTENCQALLIAPIVHDMRQDVGVAAGGHCLEEISSLDGYTIHNTIGFEQLGRVDYHMRPIEQQATRSWVSLKDSGEHIAGRPSDIDDSSERRKIVRCCDRWRFGTMKPDHCFTKY